MSVAASIFVVFLLFCAVPLANYLSVNSDRVRIETRSFTPPPPPAPPKETLPPPPVAREEKEQPRLDHRPPPLTLSQIEFILNPGTGSASGDFGVVAGLEAFNALDELAVFELSELDRHPVPIQRIAPVYPYEAKQQQLTGWVRLLFVVDEAGATRNIRVDGSSSRLFEGPAQDALRSWRFTPGMKDGRAVRTRMLLPFVFSLND
jgi:protein TonB